MPTMNVSLPEPLASFVEDAVTRGEYGTASEVVRDALRLLQREQAAREERLAILAREIEVGLNDMRDGRISDRSVTDILASVEAEERRAGGL